MKGIAIITDSLNDTLTRTVSPLINLSNIDLLKLSIYASRIGSNIKMGIRDSAGVITEITPNIAAANTWQEIEWNISDIAPGVYVYMIEAEGKKIVKKLTIVK